MISSPPISDLLSAPTPTSLLAFSLQRAGYPTALAIRNESAAPANAQSTLHLRHALPVPTLLRVFNLLHERRTHKAILILPPDPPRPRYREPLALNNSQQVTAVRRAFRKQKIRRRKPAMHLIGI